MLKSDIQDGPKIGLQLPHFLLFIIVILLLLHPVYLKNANRDIQDGPKIGLQSLHYLLLIIVILLLAHPVYLKIANRAQDNELRCIVIRRYL